MAEKRWTSTDHVEAYLERADSIPHRSEGEAAVLEYLPAKARRILDLETGDGRLLALLKRQYPDAQAIALDFSPAMLERARQRFAGDASITVLPHDLEHPLPELEAMDVVVSSFAIHHLDHERKRALYSEVHHRLAPGGVFCNLEHVSSPTIHLHENFLRRLGIAPEDEDSSNKLLDVHTQLEWLREIGFTDVDCLWKWRELALLVGRMPSHS